MPSAATCIDKALDQLVIAALAGVAAFIRFSASEPVIVMILPQRACRMAGNALSARQRAGRLVAPENYGKILPDHDGYPSDMRALCNHKSYQSPPDRHAQISHPRCA